MINPENSRELSLDDQVIEQASRCFLDAICSERLRKQLISFKARAWNGPGVSASILPEFNARLGSNDAWAALKTLDLSECYQLNDGVLTLLATRVPNLEHLALASLPFITDETIRAFCAHSHNTRLSLLKSIDMSFCPLLTDQSIVSLMRHCPQLSEINLSHCPSISRGVVSHVLWCGSSNDNGHAESCGGTRLEYVSMVYASITDSDLAAIAECGVALRELRLMACKQITHIGVENLVARRGITDDPDRNRRERRSLSAIDVSFCDNVLFQQPLDGDETPTRPTLVYRYRDATQPWSDRGAVLSGTRIMNLVSALESRQYHQ
jgi:hypothetical protein